MSEQTKKISFSVSGMSCTSCAANVQKTIKKHKGVNIAVVNFATKDAFIEFDESEVGLEILQKSVKEIGFELQVNQQRSVEKIEELEKEEIKKLKSKLVVAILFSTPVFILSMVFNDLFAYQNWILMALSTVVVTYSGSIFYISAWKKIKHLTFSMDTLVALSTGIAFLFSFVNTIFPKMIQSFGITAHIYFESATVIITFILLGKYLEEKAKSRASTAIKKLMKLQPKKSTVIRNNKEFEVGIEDIKLNDLILIRPGEQIPVDGIVTTGRSFIDESMITGEPVPKDKQEKDNVFSGTLNHNGSLIIKATKIGRDTLLSKIIDLIHNAQSSKPPVQKLADKISSVFVPLVISIAVLSFILWLFFAGFSFALLALINVLIISCPCALGLATPTAIITGIGKGAQNGILIKDSESLENAKKATVLVLDKTGTITEGKPTVTDIIWTNDKNNKTYKNIFYSIELLSEHPYAKAIKNKFLENEAYKVEISDFSSLTSYGVKARFENTWHYIGNDKLIRDNGIFISKSMKEFALQLKNQAKSVIYLNNNHCVLGVVGITDPIKPTSVTSVKKLKSIGIDVYMLTGDDAQTAKLIAKKTGIKNFYAEVNPEEKVNFVKEIQEKNKYVAMAGDGINDSAALAQADVGIAMASGSDIAMESAGITLIHSDLSYIYKAIILSKSTVKVIKQNLFWAFIYNIIAIPIAAGLLIPFTGFALNPMIAGAAMAMSSVSVVGNSLRLKRLKL